MKKQCFTFNEPVKSQKVPVIVIPANAGIQGIPSRRGLTQSIAF
jgi:hypothetical protein